MKLLSETCTTTSDAGEAEIVCPGCGVPGMRSLYGVPSVPVHSVLLMPTRREAIDYPRGELALAFCGHCGFVANHRFDVDAHEYSPRYEETQGFSGTFNAFARSLAQRIVDRYDLRGKTVLEIGCGKGEFLTLLCELGAGHGIGIDPAFVPERITDRDGGRLEFIQDFYSEAYAHLQADFICCRHTLEHIAPVGQFVRQLRQTIGDRTDTLVFFELPDVMRVLAEGAFWDIYYEHCSYFSAGSLARLFRASGFDVLDLELDYDGQYILIAARPIEGASEPRLPLEHDQETLDQAADQFPTVCAASINHWRTKLHEFAETGQRVVVWGGGSKGVALLTTLGISDEVQYVVDINPYKQGKYMPGTGHEVVGPEFLGEIQPRHVLVMNPIYCREIRQELARHGVTAQLHPVGPTQRAPSAVGSKSC